MITDVTMKDAGNKGLGEILLISWHFRPIIYVIRNTPRYLLMTSQTHLGRDTGECFFVYSGKLKEKPEGLQHDGFSSGFSAEAQHALDEVFCGDPL